MITTSPAAFSIGCAPPATSMNDSRRWPSATFQPPWKRSHTPSPSGPRWTMRDSMRGRASGFGCFCMNPAMPHMRMVERGTLYAGNDRAHKPADRARLGPQHRDAVLFEQAITRRDREPGFERVRHQQPVERIAVVPGQGAHAHGRADLHRQRLDSRTLEDPREPSLCGLVEVELSERLLDRNLPGGYGARIDLVSAVFYRHPALGR